MVTWHDIALSDSRLTTAFLRTPQRRAGFEEIFARDRVLARHREQLVVRRRAKSREVRRRVFHVRCWQAGCLCSLSPPALRVSSGFCQWGRGVVSVSVEASSERAVAVSCKLVWVRLSLGVCWRGFVASMKIFVPRYYDIMVCLRFFGQPWASN